MRTTGLVLALLCATVATASAGSVQLKVDGEAALDDGSWANGLPALSADGARLALPERSAMYEIASGTYREWGVRIVPVGAVTGTWHVVFDEYESGRVSAETLDANVAALNRVLADGGFASLALGTSTGSSIELAPGVEVLGSSFSSAVLAATLVPGARSWGYVWLEGSLGVADAARAEDTYSDGGGTEWEVIPLAAIPGQPLAPLDVLDVWMTALRVGNAGLMRRLVAAPFEHAWDGTVGYGKKCKKKWLAKKAKQLAGTIACVLAEAAGFFVIAEPTSDLTTREEVALATLYAPKKVKKKLAKLVKKGHTLVRYHANEEGWDVVLVLAVKHGKVAMAFAAVEPYE